MRRRSNLAATASIASTSSAKSEAYRRQAPHSDRRAPRRVACRGNHQAARPNSNRKGKAVPRAPRCPGPTRGKPGRAPRGARNSGGPSSQSGLHVVTLNRSTSRFSRSAYLGRSRGPGEGEGILWPCHLKPAPLSRALPTWGNPPAGEGVGPKFAILIVWCKACGHQVEPDPAEMARHYGAGTAFSGPALGADRGPCTAASARNKRGYRD